MIVNNNEVIVLAHCGLYKKDGRICIPESDVMFSEDVTAKDVGLMVHLSKRVLGYSFDIFKLPKTDNFVKLGNDIYMKVNGSIYGEPGHENDISFMKTLIGQEKYVEDVEACEILRQIIIGQVKECDIKVNCIGIRKGREYWAEMEYADDGYVMKRGQYYLKVEHVDGPKLLSDFVKYFDHLDIATIDIHNGCAYF